MWHIAREAKSAATRQPALRCHGRLTVLLGKQKMKLAQVASWLALLGRLQACVGGAPPAARLPPDLAEAYQQYAPIFLAELRAMSASARAGAEGGAEFQLSDIAEFERNIPDGTPFYVGPPVVNELTTRALDALGASVGSWVPGKADCARFLRSILEDEPLVTLKISETNLFEGLNVTAGPTT